MGLDFTPPWTITSPDPEVVLVLHGEFDPTGGVEDNADPVLAESVTVGSDRPAVQWVAGGRRSVRFRSSVVSRHQLDDIRPTLDQLDLCTRKDTTLGRAPLLELTWGELTIQGFGRVRKRVAGWWGVTGWPRQVDFEIEIVEAFALDLDGSGEGTGETQHLTLGVGETFEVLADRFLGDPLRGDLIRRVNPSIAAGELEGDRVKVLERTHPKMRGKVRPTSPALLGLEATGTVAELLEDLAVDRGATTRGSSWARLPEVVAGEVG